MRAKRYGRKCETFNFLGFTHFCDKSRWGNFRMLKNFYHQVVRLAFKWVNRRSQRKSYNWAQFLRFILFNPLPKPKIYHSRLQPEAVGDVLQKPDEGNLQVRFCEGAHSNLGAITSKKKVRYGLYSTGSQRVVIFIFRPLCVTLCPLWFSENLISKISKSLRGHLAPREHGNHLQQKLLTKTIRHYHIKRLQP